MRLRWLAFLALFGVCATARPASAVIVERVVAVVGERPILLSDLRQRARPFLMEIARSAQSPTQRAAAESQALREMLQRMVDERLEEQAADKAKISVSSDEIENALANVAAQAQVSKAELFVEARRRGLSQQDYRDEIRRQLLEGKLVQLRLKGRVRVTEDDARAAYTRFLREIGTETPVDLRLLAMRIAPNSGPREVEAREALASDIVERARKGEDFCKLVNDFSDDAESKNKCGSHGAQPMNALVPQLREVVREMAPGEVAGPIRFGTEAVLIVQLASRSEIPDYEQVRDAMYSRASNEALDKQKKSWLAELRRAVYVDVRY